ncbi:MAG TPA: efflux transporter outer membrane subunit [Steroidobacteraceae bacterium]|jgi:NodT family efflux transporter outer membrane factor (OMF) lipoprotein|nr:efflux transporter outer membrane subunit [Steroidobacteraceae bacterium]
MTRNVQRSTPVVLAAAALAACAVGPNFHAPAPPATEHYTPVPEPRATVSAPGPGGTAQNLSTERDIPADWWTLFHSPVLDKLVREALADSPTVQAAQATLITAAETYKAQRGGLLLPAVDAQASATRERVPGAAFGEPSIPAFEFSLFDAAVNVTYRFDLFGASRRQLEALRAQTDYQRWELEAANLSLAGNVVTTAVSIASLHAQIGALTDIVASERDQLKVVQRQFDAGGASRSDVLAQQTQVAQNEAQLPGLEKQLAQAQHRLAVLAGRTPDDALLPDFKIDQLTLPADLPLTVPAKLVRQRPDVLAAEALLHQSTAQLGVATANLYPQLNLTGSIGSETTAASQLFGTNTSAWNIGGSLLQPLFHGGELLGLKRAARADLDRATAEYRQTVLAALQDVADTLRALEADARTLQADAITETDAQDTLTMTRLQYKVGGVSYLTLLNAERVYLEAREARVQAEAARYADTAALFQALGGGWWNRQDNGKENRP